MFGLGGGEIFIVIILAILLIGPKDFPRVASQLGRWYRQLKFAANDFKETVEKEMDVNDDPNPPSKKP